MVNFYKDYGAGGSDDKELDAKIKRLRKKDSEFEKIVSSIERNHVDEMIKSTFSLTDEEMQIKLMGDTCKFCAFYDIERGMCEKRKITINEMSESCDKWEFSGYRPEFDKN